MLSEETLIDHYEAYLSRVGKSSHTVKAYTRDLSAFAQWWQQTNGEVFNLQTVTSQDIQEYKKFLTRQGSKSSTINRRLIALSRFFQIKEQNDIGPHWLDRGEQLKLMRIVKEKGRKRDIAVIQTLLGTGLRISELAALKVFDLEISERRGQLRVRAGKGGKAREIPLDNTTRQILSAYLKEREEDGSQQLFLGQRGPINEKGIDYLVNKYAYQAQLPNCTSHTLRHSFAKNLVDSGTPLDQVATLLGHESLDTTRIYTRPSKRDLERAVRRASGEI